MTFGYEGSPDLIGLLPDGRFLGIECKSAKGRQSDAQAEFQRRVELSGGVYVLARSISDIEQRFGFLSIDI